MPDSQQFYIFHGGDDFSSDQLDLITAEVKKRSRTLAFAVKNLRRAARHMDPMPKQTKKAEQAEYIRSKLSSQKLAKRPQLSALEVKADGNKVLKGRVSYKVRGPGGRLMNIAEIKRWVDSLYDGEQGIVKQ